MFIWGKVWGFLIGFMLSRSLLGGLLGLWIGHSIDKLKRKSAELKAGGQDATSQQVFFNSVFTVMGHIAKAKGRVSAHEINFASAYMNKLGLNAKMKQQAQDMFRQGKAPDFDLDQAIDRFMYFCGGRHDLRLMFLEIEIQLAFADGELVTEERDALHRIAKRLGYARYELDKLLAMIIAGAQFHQQGQQSGRSASTSQIDNAYKLLGVSKEASDSEVKKAYRKLMAQHHPDKLIAKGLPPEMMEEAKQKTQDIQAAYEIINASR